MCEVKEITPDTDYSETKECDYKGEHYLVRDNGAVFRQKKGDRMTTRITVNNNCVLIIILSN